MDRKRMLVVSTVAIVLILTSFFFGMMSSPTYRIDIETPPDKGDTVVSVPLAGSSVTTEKMTIYNGYVTLEVDDVTLSVREIAGLAERLGGYVASSQISTQGLQTSGRVSIRVPRNRFQEAISSLSLLGRIVDQRTSSDDITERYVDLKARLENLQHQEIRLRELLAKAMTVTDILAVEKELERVRGQIESLQGQINYLERNVEMSLVSVQLSKARPWFIPPGMNWGEVFETAIRALFLVVRGLVILIVVLAPFAVIGVIILIIYRRRRLRKT